jgi:hypothetical protein
MFQELASLAPSGQPNGCSGISTMFFAVWLYRPLLRKLASSLSLHLTPFFMTCCIGQIIWHGYCAVFAVLGPLALVIQQVLAGSGFGHVTV